MGKTLVAYFSAEGTTAKVAKKLAEATKADIFEIEPEKAYGAKDLDWTDPNSRSSREMRDKEYRPAIKNRVDNMAEYGVIYVGFPIWWYVAPTIINTFLESYDLSGKTVIPFATSGGSGMGNTNSELEKSCKGATLKEGKRFKSDVTEEELKKWVEGVQVFAF